MSTHLFSTGDQERKSVLATLLRLLSGDVGDAIVDGVLGRRDRGKFSVFLKNLATELTQIDHEYSRVNPEEREWVDMSIESILKEVALDLSDRSQPPQLLRAALRGPYALAPYLRATSAATDALVEATEDTSSYLQIAIDTLSVLLCDWVATETHAQRLAQSSGIGELLSISDSLSASIESVVDSIEEVDARLSRTRAEAVQRGYQTIIQERMPVLLVDRADELSLARSLVRGDASTLAWLAPEKAGKSGLAYTIAHEGMESADIVPFFIRQRDALSNSLEAFLFVTGAFLAGQVGERYGPPDGGGVDAVWGWKDLLQRATYACRSRGKQLVLLVDGLDEELAHHGAGRSASIASVLPGRAELQALGLKVIVTSRPNPPVPPDVPDDHWLRARGSWTSLRPSAVAAKAVDPSEIDALMGAEPGRSIAGLLAACAAPLTVGDIASLLEISIPTARSVLRHGVSRNLMRSHDPSGVAQYEIGHESTLARIVQNLAPSYADAVALRDRHDWAAIRDRALKPYRQLVLKEAARASRRGWEDCPPFLLSEAFVRLAEVDSSKWAHVVAWLVDTNRHSAQRASGMTAIDCAQQLRGAAKRSNVRDLPELLALQKILVNYRRISPGGLEVPLGAVDACLAAGDTQKAFAVAEGVETAAGAASAYLAVAKAAGAAGDVLLAQRAIDAAEEVTSRITMIAVRQTTYIAVAENFQDLGRAADARRVGQRLRVPSGTTTGPEELADRPEQISEAQAGLPNGSPLALHEEMFINLVTDVRLTQLIDTEDAAVQLVEDAVRVARGLDTKRMPSALSDVAAALMVAGDEEAAMGIYDELLVDAGKSDLDARLRILTRAIENLNLFGPAGSAQRFIERCVPRMLRIPEIDPEVCLLLASACRAALSFQVAEDSLRRVVMQIDTQGQNHTERQDDLLLRVIAEYSALGNFPAAQALAERLPSALLKAEAQAMVSMADGGPDHVARLEDEATQEVNGFVAQSMWLTIAQRHADAGSTAQSFSAIGKAWAAGGDYTCGWEIAERLHPGSARSLAELVPLR